jgi:hypothetical protein
MAASSVFAIRVVEHTNLSPANAGAYNPLESHKHHQSSQPEWRFPLCGLLCLVLAVLIPVWGTAYKLSLYKTDQRGAPAKVCTRGSDAAKTGVSQAINGRKVLGNGTAGPMLTGFSLLRPRCHEISLGEACQPSLPLSFGTVYAARPPPTGFLSLSIG